MRIMIDCTDEKTSERILDLVHYKLSTSNADIRKVRISLRHEEDPLGSRLVHCHMETRLMSNENIAIDEIQSSRELAVTRAIERTSRTLCRKLAAARESRTL